MRYKETGNVHLDFHAAVNTTVEYIEKKYGDEALRKILFEVGKKVYKSINDKLAAGDVSDLLEFWEYFLKRENGVFTIEKQGDEIVLNIISCPAVRHVRRLGLPLSKSFCKQTEYMNIGLCDGTPFVIELEKTGEASCRQVLKKRENAR